MVSPEARAPGPLSKALFGPFVDQHVPPAPAPAGPAAAGEAV